MAGSGYPFQALSSGGLNVSRGGFDDRLYGGGGGGGGGNYQTTPSQAPADRASQAGLSTTSTTVTSTSQITGAANTLYLVDGTNPNGGLTWDGPIGLGGVDDVAVCGINDARLVIPAGFRDYAVNTGNTGTGFLWSGIDIDQRADGAMGRINARVDDNATIEYCAWLGEGRRANPSTTADYGGAGKPTIAPAVNNAGGTSTIKNVVCYFGGVLADEHQGDRPIGIFMAGNHNGTLQIRRTQLEEFPNNALYASATPGSVVARDCRLWNNGVSQGRIAHGEFRNVSAGYDHTDTGMDNADAPNHGIVGLVAEQKNAAVGSGPPPDVINCSVEMRNVAKSGGAIVAYDLPGNPAAEFGTIGESDTHIYNAQDAPDIHLEGPCDGVTNTVLSGTADGGTALVNDGPAVDVSNVIVDYPDGRMHYAGAIA